MSKLYRFMFYVVAVIMMCSTTYATVWYVDNNQADDLGEGLSWITAKKNIQSAINAAQAGDEIRVRSGIYLGTITLKSGISLYGGYTGSEANPDERNLAAQPTILTRSTSGARIVNMVNVSNTHFDGFRIRGGLEQYLSGAGMLIQNSDASNKISNCMFIGNEAGSTVQSYFGGAIYIVNASPVLHNCIFANNKARARGGAISASNSNPLISSCTFVQNEASDLGAALHLRENSNATIINSLFVNNTCLLAAGRGGGITAVESVATISNCLFLENNALSGGGIHAIRSTIDARNSIFAHNQEHALIEVNPVATTLLNNIFYENSPTASYPGNIESDPRFVMDGSLRMSGTCTNTPQAVSTGLSSLDVYTVLSDENAQYVPNIFTGHLLKIENSDNPYHLIISNSENALYIMGDVSGDISIDDSYVIADFRLMPDSPAIDQGGSTNAPDHDFLGNPRPVAIPGIPSHNPETAFDIGPYEMQEPPVVISTNPVPQAVTNLSEYTYRVEFSRAVIGVSVSNFYLLSPSIVDADILEVTGENTVWHVLINTGNGDGSLTLNVVDDGQITDDSGMPLGGPVLGSGNFTSGESLTVEKSNPTIHLETEATSPTNQSVMITVSISKPDTDFSPEHISTNNALVNNFTGIGDAYTFTLTPVNAGEFTASIDIGQLKDSHGNYNHPSNEIRLFFDNIPPVLHLIGDNPLRLEVFDNFIDPGATAEDNYDGDITSQIQVSGTVDTNTVGSYNLSYTVQDTAGNQAVPVTRTVQVLDSTPPNLNLIGDNPLRLEVFDNFIDPGATAYDNYDGDITSQILVSGTVDTNTVGSYNLSYAVQDTAGNQAIPITRTVLVMDSTPPTLNLIGDNPLRLEVFDNFIDPGATAYDNYDGDITSQIQVSGTVDANTVGSYNLSYTVQDTAGNQAIPITRTVQVLDSTPPNLNLLGDNPLRLEVFESFIDPGATAYDNYDGDITSQIQVSGTVDANTVGSYNLSYTVQDNAGNQAVPATRTVQVLDSTPPNLNLLGDNPLRLEVFDTFIDPGATAYDNYDGDITSQIQVSGTIDSNTVGSYELYYRIMDSSSNETTRTRTVLVEVSDNENVPNTYQIELRSPVEMLISGGYAELSVPTGMQSYAWLHDGILLNEGDRMSGTTSNSLRIQNLLPSDSGIYLCSFEDANLSYHVTEPYELVVPDAPAVPAGHLIPFMFLTGSITILGCYISRKYD